VRFMAKERELISAGARTAELGLERKSLYVAAYGGIWKSRDFRAPVSRAPRAPFVRDRSQKARAAREPAFEKSPRRRGSAGYCR
jgi:hypothetical protein